MFGKISQEKENEWMMDNSLFIDMSFRGWLLWVWFVLLKFTLVLVSPGRNFMMWVSLVVSSLMFSGVKFFEDLQPLFLLYIVVMNKLGMVERYVGQRLTKIV